MASAELEAKGLLAERRETLVEVVQERVEAATRERGTEQLDGLIRLFAWLGELASPEQARALVALVRSPAPVLEERVPAAGWQHVTYWVARAQVEGKAGELPEAARAHLQVARRSPARAAEALDKARAAFAAAGAFDEWLRETKSPIPPLGDSLGADLTPLQRQVVTHGLPLLETFFTRVEAPGRLRFDSIVPEVLTDLADAGVSPNAREFLESFHSSSSNESYQGVLILLPSEEAGFVVDGVWRARHRKSAGPLLDRALKRQRDADGEVSATWSSEASMPNWLPTDAVAPSPEPLEKGTLLAKPKDDRPASPRKPRTGHRSATSRRR
jgi:hypothetical protein